MTLICSDWKIGKDCIFWWKNIIKSLKVIKQSRFENDFNVFSKDFLKFISHTFFFFFLEGSSILFFLKNLKFSLPWFFNPNQTGLFAQSKDWVGGIPPAGLSLSYGHNFHPNLPKMNSKDFWHNYPSMKNSKTILWFKFFPKQGAKVTSSDKAKFSASKTKIFENI